MSTTAASTSILHVHINRAFTPNSGCHGDAEGQLNTLNQVLHHDESTCLLLNNTNIRDKSICEAVKQNNAKKFPQHGKPREN
eukprot:10213700-Ditylum_brightwellii.AAC.2